MSLVVHKCELHSKFEEEIKAEASNAKGINSMRFLMKYSHYLRRHHKSFLGRMVSHYKRYSSLTEKQEAALEKIIDQTLPEILAAKVFEDNGLITCSEEFSREFLF